MVSYWSKLLLHENLGTLTTGIYLATKHRFNLSNITSRSRYFKWVYEIKSILDSTGNSEIWNSQDSVNRNWFIKAINQKLRDAFLSDWYKNVDEDLNYRLFKHKFELEPYLINTSIRGGFRKFCHRCYNFVNRHNRLLYYTLIERAIFLLYNDAKTMHEKK